MRRKIDHIALVVDGAWAIVVAIFGSVPIAAWGQDARTSWPLSDPAWIACLAALTAATVVRRTFPKRSALIVAAAVIMSFLILSDTVVLGQFTILVALAGIVLHGGAGAQLVFYLISVAVGAVGAAHYSNSVGHGALLFGLVTFAITAVLIGSRTLKYERQLEEQRRMEAEQQAAQAAVEAELAVISERGRIAREMHDIVAHTLSVVIAQADGGRYAGVKNPAKAQDALDTIADLARAALADIRSIISALRDPQEDAPLDTQPTDVELDALIDRVRGTGLAVTLTRTGTARALPPGARSAVFRVIQESLTNCLKHAGPSARAAVLLAWHPRALHLTIEDNGRGAHGPAAPGGHGILGMKERLEFFGGTLAAGPSPGGGWRVLATVPLGVSRVNPNPDIIPAPPPERPTWTASE